MGSLFSYIDLEKSISAQNSLRKIRGTAQVHSFSKNIFPADLAVDPSAYYDFPHGNPHGP